MLDIAAILGTATAISGNLLSATEIGKNLKEMFKGETVDPVAAREQVIDLLNQIINAQIQQAQVHQTLLLLQQELKDRDRFDADAARYALTKSGRGAAFYTLKPNDPLGEPSHSICPNCLSNRIKSFLQPGTGGGNFLTCNTCKQDFAVHDRSEGSGIMIGQVRRGLGAIDDF